MAGGNKKKKKPAANPARGFATTSIASKPKIEQQASETASTDASGVPTSVESSAGTSSCDASKIGVSNVSNNKELHDLSPEELEAQLEASELQQFVERHGARVKKETVRQVTRLQTDKRLLRGQADFLSLKEWLPQEQIRQILDLALLDLRHDSDLQRKYKSTVSDEFVTKVWTLRQCLLDLGISLSRVNEVLGWLVSRSSPDESPSLGWGLDECLDWLALHCDINELEEYDSQQQKTIAPIDEIDDLDEIGTNVETKDDSLKGKDSRMYRTTDDNFLDPEGGPEVSDLESDLEPEILLETYLKAKKALFELDPLADKTQLRKNKSNKGGKAPPLAGKTRGQVKLEQKILKIESDVLFDQREADATWATMKIELARESADRRRLQLLDGNQSTTPEPTGNGRQINDEAERLGEELLRETAEGGEDDMLSGMFDALPGVDQTPTTSDRDVSDVEIRDFGRMTGMNPKRVVEEACKARDQRCKLMYRQVSPTTYSCRHSLYVQWTKDQDVSDPTFLTGVSVKRKPGTIVITSLHIATPDVAQSEAYIATVAMFLLFSDSPKEEKAHLRLPPAFRNLWDELVAQKQNYVYAEDAIKVQEVRRLIETHRNRDDVEDDDDDEVVFNANRRRRLNGTIEASSPAQEKAKAISPDFSEELQQGWARKTASPSYQRMLTTRMNLPMFQFRETALDTIQRHQVTILCGETGCGKSTQLPAFILEDELSHGRPCKIYCTEPRRISAISLAQRVSEELGENKGDLGTARSVVGYAIRLESLTSAQTRLVYATVGIVLRMLEGSDGLDNITHLVIDEVHERSIDTDFLLIVLRSLMAKRPDLKVVLMSATVDANKFSQYLDGAPIIDVPGRTFPVQAYYLEDAIELTGHTNEDAAASAVDEENLDDEQQNASTGQQLEGYSRRTQKVLDGYDEYRIDFSLIIKLLEKIAHHAQYEPFSKAILVFLPGIAEIRQLNDMLGGHPRFMKGWRVHPLHSSFSSQDQQAAFDVPPLGVRKIVLATNIAETGITIPDVTCVIDTGKHKEMRFDERRQMSRLVQSFIARANAKQRRGRAGRVQEGICFHLFTKFRHDQLMVDQQTPEMLRLSLQDLVMRVKICKLGDIEHALSQALDPPSSRNIRRAIDALVEVGALTTGEDLTSLGSQLAKLPLDAQLGKLIIFGSTFGCLDFALTAAATLSSKSPFLSPMHQKKQADTVRLGFRRGDSDLLTAFNAYATWRKVCQTPGLSEFAFCNKNFLSPQNLANIEDLKGQLFSSLIDAGFVHLSNDERTALSKARHGSRFIALPPSYCRSDGNDAVISSVIAWSFYPKIIKQEGKGWRNIANNQSLALHPTSVNKTSLPSEVRYLSFYSIMQSSSRFTNVQETSAVSDVALALMSGDAVFHMHAGVVVIDGNRLRFKLRDWRAMIALKLLRSKLKDVLGRLMKTSGRDLGDRPKRWMEILERIFERIRPAPVGTAAQIR